MLAESGTDCSLVRKKIIWPCLVLFFFNIKELNVIGHQLLYLTNVLITLSLIYLQEAQGFSRSESSQRLLYNYNKDKSKSPSPTKSTAATCAKAESPQKKSPVKQSSPVKNTIYHSKYSSPVKESNTVREASPVKGR